MAVAADATIQEEQAPLDLRPKWGSEEEEEPLDLRPKWGSEEEEEDDDDDDESFGDVAGASDVLIQELPWDAEDEDEEDDESWRNDECYKDKNRYREIINPKEWRKYLRHLEKSRGYDMPRFRKVVFCGIRPCYSVFSSTCILDEVVESSKFALEQHNKEKGTKFELYKFMKVMEEPVSGTVYYITFQGEDLKRIGDTDTATSSDGSINKVKVGPNGGLLVEFQAQVWYKLPDKNRICKMELLDFCIKDTLTDKNSS